MRLDYALVVAKREYLQRVRSKAFWIGVLALPLLMVGMTVLPALLLSKAPTDQRIVIVDETGKVGKELAPAGRSALSVKAEEMGTTRFQLQVEAPRPDREAQVKDLQARVLGEEIDAWLWIGKGVLNGQDAEYHARSVSNFMTQSRLREKLSQAVRRVRLRDAGFDPDRVGALTGPTGLKTVRVSKEGSRTEQGEASFFFAYILFFLLYMMLILWGQQVMNGVLEEKGTRVVEVVISSLTPFELMMGKLWGICLAGFTQFGVWLVTAAVLTAPVIATSLSLMPGGASLPVLAPVMVLHFLVLYILGFFVIGALYAAIGASFNNVQEAQQGATIVLVFVIVPVLLMFRMINAPSSTFSVVASLIPPFTPLLMTLRVALEMPPLWQLLLSYVLTAGFIVLMVWLCARIYRFGILMYGKKPTFKEIWRWARTV